MIAQVIVVICSNTQNTWLRIEFQSLAKKWNMSHYPNRNPRSGQIPFQAKARAISPTPQTTPPSDLTLLPPSLPYAYSYCTHPQTRLRRYGNARNQVRHPLSPTPGSTLLLGLPTTNTFCLRWTEERILRSPRRVHSSLSPLALHPKRAVRKIPLEEIMGLGRTVGRSLTLKEKR